jgi:hypothetical protein
LGDEFRSLKYALHNDEQLYRTVLKGDVSNGFVKSWAALQQRFPLVHSFCGGIATVFPGTSTMEYDFSVLSYEFDDHRRSITELSLEGILQAKQYEKLQSLKC